MGAADGLPQRRGRRLPRRPAREARHRAGLEQRILGAELVGNRGTDPRLDQSSRRTTQERREEYHRRMDAKQAARDGLAQERDAARWNEDSVEVERWDEEG